MRDLSQLRILSAAHKRGGEIKFSVRWVVLFAQVAGAAVIQANELSFALSPPQMLNQPLISPAIARSFV